MSTVGANGKPVPVVSLSSVLEVMRVAIFATLAEAKNAPVYFPALVVLWVFDLIQMLALARASVRRVAPLARAVRRPSLPPARARARVPPCPTHHPSLLASLLAPPTIPRSS